MKWIHPLGQRISASFVLFATVLILACGCQTNSNPAPTNDRLSELLRQQAGGTNATGASFTIREGDVVKINFPGAPNLNTVQQVRRDGKIELPLLGELQAAGATPGELEQDVLKRYGNQLLSKEVTVTVETASYDVFVTGAILKPGKVTAVRPITALEAIMESGGPDYTKANLKDVTIVRQENGRSRNYHVNLREVLDGKRSSSFYLKPSDIIYVRERFNWF